MNKKFNVVTIGSNDKDRMIAAGKIIKSHFSQIRTIADYIFDLYNKTEPSDADVLELSCILHSEQSTSKMFPEAGDIGTMKIVLKNFNGKFSFTFSAPFSQLNVIAIDYQKIAIACSEGDNDKVIISFVTATETQQCKIETVTGIFK